MTATQSFTDRARRIIAGEPIAEFTLSPDDKEIIALLRDLGYTIYLDRSGEGKDITYVLRVRKACDIVFEPGQRGTAPAHSPRHVHPYDPSRY